MDRHDLQHDLQDVSRGDQSRSEIFEAARTLFLTNGYNGTSMRAIADAAGGRAVAGLYNHFPTKEAIFAGLLEVGTPYEALGDILESVEADDAASFMRQAISQLVETMPAYYDYFQLAQIDFREFGGRHLHALLQGRVFPRILRAVARIQSLPGLKPIEPLVMMRIMGSLIIGFIVTDNLMPQGLFGHHSHQDWARFLSNALLDGLVDPTGDTPDSPSSR